MIDWEGAKVVDKETNRCARWIKEAIWIRKTKPTMNRDEGGYRLCHVWDSLLATPSNEQWPTFSSWRRPPMAVETLKWVEICSCVMRNYTWMIYFQLDEHFHEYTCGEKFTWIANVPEDNINGRDNYRPVFRARWWRMSFLATIGSITLLVLKTTHFDRQFDCFYAPEHYFSQSCD